MDTVAFSRPRHVAGLELLSASYAPRSFPTHVHPEWVIGAIVEGAERLTMRGRDWNAGTGSVLVIPPGEAHANAAMAGRRMGYRVFYVPDDLVAAERCAIRLVEPVLSSASLFRRVVAAHRTLAAQDDALEQQSAFSALLHALSGRRGGESATRAAPARLQAARDYLEAHFRGHCSLTEVSAEAGVSNFHLARSFRSQFGVSPIAYRNQLRVMEARRLLRGGMAIAETALEVGLADQSHLTRLFQQVMGTTPGRYAQQ